MVQYVAAMFYSRFLQEGLFRLEERKDSDGVKSVSQSFYVWIFSHTIPPPPLPPPPVCVGEREKPVFLFTNTLDWLLWICRESSGILCQRCSRNVDRGNIDPGNVDLQNARIIGRPINNRPQNDVPRIIGPREMWIQELMAHLKGQSHEIIK